MRPIKFRGKIISGEWVHGLLTCENGNWYMSNDVGNPYAYMLRPETIGQFTRLQDKNGVEIYFGDILSYADLSPGDTAIPFEVKFEDQSWNEDGFCTGAQLSFTADQYEVIGNIYENPELVDADKGGDK